jgi:hypothetical protein
VCARVFVVHRVSAGQCVCVCVCVRACTWVSGDTTEGTLIDASEVGCEHDCVSECL